MFFLLDLQEFLVLLYNFITVVLEVFTVFMKCL